MMRPSLLPAILAAAALALAACSSTSGTATAADSLSGSTGPSQVVSSAPPAPSPAVDTGSAGDAPAGAADAAADAPATVGDGALDAQSSNWFNTACTGMQPLGGMLATVMGVAMGAAGVGGTSAAAPDAAALQGQLVSALDAAGAALSDTADKLADTPPPTFDKGEQMAADFINYLKSTGPKVSEIADKVKASPVTDTASLGAAFSQIQSLSAGDLDGADPLSGYGLDPATEKAVEELPACKAMQSGLGGMMGAGSAG